MKRLLRPFVRRLNWGTQQKLGELYAAFFHPFGKRRSQFSYHEVAAVPKHTDVSKVLDRLLRYQICLGEEIPFDGRTVLEIGAGPLLGWALCGLALGAKRYYLLEPQFNPELLTQFNSYFKEHRRYVCRVLGPVGSLRDMMADGHIQAIRRMGHDTGLPGKSVDLILSNSVLEHVHDMPEFVRELYRISSPQCVQYHIVTLHDHTRGGDPFSHLYSFHPDRWRRLFARRGLGINMMRPSDLSAAFSSHFQVKQIIFLQDSSHPSIQKAHSYWRDRYSTEELGIDVLALKLIPRR